MEGDVKTARVVLLVIVVVAVAMVAVVLINFPPIKP